MNTWDQILQFLALTAGVAGIMLVALFLALLIMELFR